MENTSVFMMAFTGVYPQYLNKAAKKGRAKEEVDSIIYCLTGNDVEGL